MGETILKEYRAGIDIGSTTVKLVVLDAEDHIIYGQYRRHMAKTQETLAARCGVFAKTDIQPLINEGATTADLAASIFQAVVNQTISGLACGKPIRGCVAFLGGPLHFMPELKKAFIRTLKLTDETTVDPENSHLFAAMGAAIEQGIIPPSTKQRLETLEISKRELEDKILIENMKRPLRTEDELWAWFRYMRNFDLTRLEERRQLIDVFVNTVFLYNDRFLLTLNFGYGSKTVLFTDIPCSDKVACGRPYRVFITDLSYGHSLFFIKIFNVTSLMAKITQRHLWQNIP